MGDARAPPRSRLDLAVSAGAPGATAIAVRRPCAPGRRARARRRDAGRDGVSPRLGEGRCGCRRRRRGGGHRLRSGRRPRRPRHRQAGRSRARPRPVGGDARPHRDLPDRGRGRLRRERISRRRAGAGDGALSRPERCRDRALPARRNALRLRRQRQDRNPRHRPRRERRLDRPDRADRPAADPHLRVAAPGGHRSAASNR